jgi:PAS domain S-box-containing protein
VVQRGNITEILSFLNKEEERLATHIEGLYYNDAKGRVYSTSGKTFSVRDRYYFPAINRGETVITKAILSRDTQRPIILILVPIFDAKSNRIGAIGGTILLENLFRKISQIKVGQTGFAVLVDEDGQALSGLPHEEEGSFHEFFSRKLNNNVIDTEISHLINQMTLSKAGSSRLNMGGDTYYAYYKPIENMNWHLALVYKEAEILSDVRRTRNIVIAILFIFFIFVLAMVYGLNRALLAPIRELAEAHRRFGEGDISVRAREGSSDEIGDLSRSFNKMVDQLNQAADERRMAEQALRESEERFRLTFENAKDAIFWADPQTGLITNCNKAAEILLEKKREEIIGQHQTTLHPSQKAKYYSDMFREHISRGSVDDEAEVITKSGKVIPVHITSSITLVGGKSIIQGIFRNITECKRAEEALKKSEKHLREVLDGLGPYMLVGLMTPDGTLIEANRPALKIAGLKPEDVLGKPFEETYWWSYSESLKQQLRDTIRRAARGEICRYDVAVRVGENRFITIDFCLQPLVDERGRVLYLIPSAVDITERKKAEEKLRRAHEELEVKVAERTKELAQANIQLKEMDRLKSEFLATMSHELRTPLNSIIGFTGIVLKGIAGKINQEQKKQLSMVYDSAKHLLSLINDILDLSRIESGKMEVFVERFKIEKVISEVTQTLSPMISQKGLKLITEIPDETPHIYSDRKKTLQILLNLVNNAVKFTDKGEIKIECKIDDDNLIVSVSDAGIGIRREDMNYLFEAFRQINGTARRRYQGAGLGLYLCKKLVTLLGGEIWAESEYGKGSKFTFILPLKFQKKEL